MTLIYQLNESSDSNEGKDYLDDLLMTNPFLYSQQLTIEGERGREMKKKKISRFTSNGFQTGRENSDLVCSASS